MPRKLIILTTLLCLCALPALALDPATLNAYFDALDKSERYMGGVALMKDGQLLYERNLGWADRQSGQPADESTRYRIGSISKTFTAPPL